MSWATDLPASAKLKFRPAENFSAENLGDDGQVARDSLTWRVPHGDRRAFLDVVFGLPEVVPGTIGGAVTRVVPMHHPEFTNLLAVNVRGPGMGFTAGATAANNTWAEDHLTVDFQSRPYPLTGLLAFIKVEGDPASRTIPGLSPMVLLADGTNPLYDPGIETQGQEISATIYGLPSLQLDTYYALADHVNNAPFFGFPTGSVIYRMPRVAPTSALTILPSYTFRHVFSASRIRWDWLPGATGTMQLAHFSNGDPFKVLSDLTTLFA